MVTFMVKLPAQLGSKNTNNTHADTLRGSYGSGRDWWDVVKYDLHVKFSITDSLISGYNDISLRVLKKGKNLQLDLQEPLILDSIIFSSNSFTPHTIKEKFIVKDGNAYFVSDSLLTVNSTNIHLFVYYHGKPRIAKRPPWDGGLIWKKD